MKLQKEREKEKEKEKENRVFLEGLTSTLKSIENQNAEMKLFLSSLTEQRISSALPPSTPTGKSKREEDLELKLKEQQSQIENLRTLVMDQRSLFSNPVKSPWIPPPSPSLPAWQMDGPKTHQSYDIKKKEQENSFEMKQRESDGISTSTQLTSKVSGKFSLF